MVTQAAVADGHSLPAGRPARLDLHCVRASGLAQARLQLAVLSGNRRRALEQIDRLVEIDKQLERVAEGQAPAPCGDLAGERLALASEKLALTAEVRLPQLQPAFGAGMAMAVPPDEPVVVVEHEALRSRLFNVVLWGAGFLILCVGVAAAAVLQL